MTAGPVDLTITFLSPVEVGDAFLLGALYLIFHV